ncbi:helix-turn-helix domain-containing protein [Enterococcus dongliensis]|uniref:Helix-turn-helix transcriptional regulator n=1 Tax=Enterococcus dongliensis TaxID=2559925 RepID=A0AAW8TQJ0_9ENTE|nr:helix-turn-helix transcriptional regulator [Enterococcus dongliensis]MDT2637968.1 helix-turn-helix transcriptional regulator [Enterococcus dongliensis]
MDIGLCIKQQRQKLGMTQEELSELSGVSRVSIGNYERGDREPTVSIAIAIAESLGVTFEELVFAKTENTFKAELGKTYDQDGNEPLYETKQEPNLLEIKLKDTDSVPEVWYKGERLGEYPECLVDISYHWNTGGTNDNGANDINIEYYSTPNDKYLDKKTIGHKREI